MSAIKLHVIKPSVNNMTARVFVRAAKLDFTEDDVYGKTRTEDFWPRNPAHLTPMMEARRPAEGRGVGELRDHAVSLQQASSRQVLSDRAGKARHGRQRDVLYRRHALSLSRRARPMARSASRTMRARSARATPTPRRRTRRRRRRLPPWARRSRCSANSISRGKTFIGGDHVSIADIRLAASLEFLHAIDYPVPGWLGTYWSAVKHALGAAYAEPAKDVEGYIAYVKGLKK